jgi:hypothetical protein
MPAEPPSYTLSPAFALPPAYATTPPVYSAPPVFMPPAYPAASGADLMVPPPPLAAGLLALGSDAPAPPPAAGVDVPPPPPVYALPTPAPVPDAAVAPAAAGPVPATLELTVKLLSGRSASMAFDSAMTVAAACDAINAHFQLRSSALVFRGQQLPAGSTLAETGLTSGTAVFAFEPIRQ